VREHREQKGVGDFGFLKAIAGFWCQVLGGGFVLISFLLLD
jgi:hypothetical protein